MPKDVSKKKNSKLKKTFATVRGNTQLMLGLIFLLVLLAIAFFGPMVAPFNPKVLNDDLLAPPGDLYRLGTDNLGRDVFSQVLYGAKTSLEIGFTAAMISAVIGVIFGGIAGFYGGIADRILNEIMNIFLMLPTFFLTVLAFVPFAYIYSHGGGSGLDLGRKSARGSHAKHGSKYSLGKL